MRRRRILYYTDSTAVGGAEHALAHLVAEVQHTVEAVVACVRAEVLEAIAADHAVQRLLLRRPRHKLDVNPIRDHVRALRHVRPDVLHANLISPWSCQFAIALALALRVPVVAVYQLPGPPVNRRQLLLKRLTTRGVAAHVGVGERTSAEIEHLLALEPGTALTVHNGIPVTSRERSYLGGRGSPGPGSDPRPVVGTVGRLAPQKGIDLLLRALQDLPDARTMVVGDGEERGTLERLAIDLNVADRVTWTGWATHPDQLLRSMDIFVLASRNEGFPLAILEAQLAGLPVVATDVGSVREAVVDGETGLLVPPERPDLLARAVRRLLDDADERDRLGRGGRARVVELFSARGAAAAFEEIYVKVAP